MKNPLNCAFTQRMAVLLLVVSCSMVVSQAVEYDRGLTEHFISWLNDTKHYEPFNFNRSDSIGGSFGGKDDDDTPVNHRPIIFIHGTSDMAIGYEPINNGFRIPIEYFLSRGYTKAELYAT